MLNKYYLCFCHVQFCAASFFYKENSPLCFLGIAGCPDFILLYVPEVLSQKHFEKCSDCLGSRYFDLAIVHSLVQLAFGGSHKGGSGGSADGTDGDDHSQHNEEGVLHRGVVDAQQVDIIELQTKALYFLWSRMANFYRMPQVSPFHNGSNMQQEPPCIRTAALAIFRYFILRTRRHGSRG